jgi:hypothetical protein
VDIWLSLEGEKGVTIDVYLGELFRTTEVSETFEFGRRGCHHDVLFHGVIYDDLTCTQRGLDNAWTTLVDLRDAPAAFYAAAPLL